MTGHWRIFHVHSNIGPSPWRDAAVSAISGPATISVKEMSTKMLIVIVSTIARDCTFHQDRASRMP